jgi:ABC-type antimicrobial peptide transport system permease subunit
LVVGRGLRLAAIGVSLGLLGALTLTRTLASLLYGVTPLDPLTFVGVPLLLAAVTAAASMVPANRAAGLDPVEALRE